MSADVVVRFLADTSKLQSEVAKVEGTGAKMKSWAKGVGVAIGAAFALDFARDAVNSASDLNETLNKTRVVFGENADEIERWSESAATSFGLSQNAALSAVSTFGDMFSQLGFAGDQAQEMSTGVVQLAADLGSFHNLDTGQVLDMLGASFRGEFDSLQKLVPNINAARVEHEALAATGKTAASELTAQEKAAATLAVVMEDSANAAGDFAETSGSLANQTKTASAQFDDAKASLGQALLPVITKVVDILNDYLIPAFEWFAKNNLVIPILAFAAALWVLNAALAANPIVLIVLAVVALIAGIVLLWTNWDRVWSWIMDHKGYAAVIAWFLPIVAAIVVLVGIVKWLWENWDTIWNAIQAVVGVVVDKVQSDWNALSGFFSTVVGAFRRYLELVAAALRLPMDAATAVYEWVRDKFQSLADFLSGIVDGIASTVRRIGSALKAPINAVIRGWNAIEFKVPSVDLGPLGKIGGQTIGFPTIPELATGGIVTRATLALIGERGPEAVVPLDRLAGRGASYVLNVSVAAGTDPAQTGRTIVEYIRAYERANGRDWRAS